MPGHFRTGISCIPRSNKGSKRPLRVGSYVRFAKAAGQKQKCSPRCNCVLCANGAPSSSGGVTWHSYANRIKFDPTEKLVIGSVHSKGMTGVGEP